MNPRISHADWLAIADNLDRKAQEGGPHAALFARERDRIRVMHQNSEARPFMTEQRSPLKDYVSGRRRGLVDSRNTVIRTPAVCVSQDSEEAFPSTGRSEPMSTKTKEKKPRHNPWKAKPERSEQEPAVEANPQTEAKPGMSCIDAAAKVLGESNEPMNTRQMIEAMKAKGYWTSPAGKTPAATLKTMILREMRKEGSRFVKTGPGHYRIA